VKREEVVKLPLKAKLVKREEVVKLPLKT